MGERLGEDREGDPVGDAEAATEEDAAARKEASQKHGFNELHGTAK